MANSRLGPGLRGTSNFASQPERSIEFPGWTLARLVGSHTLVWTLFRSSGRLSNTINGGFTRKWCDCLEPQNRETGAQNAVVRFRYPQSHHS